MDWEIDKTVRNIGWSAVEFARHPVYSTMATRVLFFCHPELAENRSEAEIAEGKPLIDLSFANRLRG